MLIYQRVHEGLKHIVQNENGRKNNYRMIRERKRESKLKFQMDFLKKRVYIKQ